MLSLKLLFWNAPTLPALSRAAREHSPDIVIVAEGRANEMKTLRALNAEESGYSVTQNRSLRLQFFVRFSPSRLRSMHDGPGVAARRIDTVLGEEILLVALHLPSKLRWGQDDQVAIATRTGATIRELEARVGHSRTVVIGDFNMNPFENGLVSSEGFHAVSTRLVAARRMRKVMGESREFFYNPMWSLLGDGSAGPPGTFYYGSSTPHALFWHMTDQVLFRPCLSQNFQPGDVAVLESLGEMDLVGANGRPKRDISDHLPILATVRFLEATYGDN